MLIFMIVDSILGRRIIGGKDRDRHLRWVSRIHSDDATPIMHSHPLGRRRRKNKKERPIINTTRRSNTTLLLDFETQVKSAASVHNFFLLVRIVVFQKQLPSFPSTFLVFYSHFFEISCRVFSWSLRNARPLVVSAEVSKECLPHSWV